MIPARQKVAMNISDVSKTAVLTLISRVTAAERKTPAIDDPVAVLCLENLLSLATDEEKRWILRVRKICAGIMATDINTLINRVKYFDRMVDEFVAKNPSCTVINLACGFDTRYWRLVSKNFNYIELDLPEVVALKKELLKEQIDYELIGCSVLDVSWIDQVTLNGNTNILILAEGILMFLPGQEVKSLIQLISQRFINSQITLEFAFEKYTKGFWKLLADWYWKAFYGLDVTFVSGIKKPQDFESFSKCLKIMDEGKGSVGPLITASINSEV
jgi:O-methyltransferase involved in polyketide biosynthesis